MQDTDHLPSHKYQQLPLISIDEFLQAQPEHGDDDEKTTMFARINHELKEREELENVREELLERKQSLIADNQKWKDDLATLDKGLEMFIDVCTIMVSRIYTTLTYHRVQTRSKESSKKNIYHFKRPWVSVEIEALPVTYSMIP